ncbi:MAG: glycosyl transferase family protein [Rhodomicrobium sp.]
MMPSPHPFARFVQILGRGKSLTRALTVEEAQEAMSMILAGKVLPEQLGAFLMLLRVKEESPEEIAGFVRAAREAMALPSPLPQPDLDWSSYAGKRRQLPWFILAAALLARNGVRVFMHGTEGHTPGRVYTREVLARLGFPIASSFGEAAAHLGQRNFAYLPLEHISAELARLINLRPILGLRSPVHTLSRMLNPFAAPVMLQGIFHPGYMTIHQKAALLLGQPHMAVFRGEGGEIERRPNKPCEVLTVHQGATAEERWPALLPEPRQSAEDDMDLGRLLALWRGDATDEYGEAAIWGTLAIALKALGRADSQEDAQILAQNLWADRDRTSLNAAA